MLKKAESTSNVTEYLPIPESVVVLFEKQLAQGNLNGFYDAILKNPMLNQYAKHPFMEPFWDRLLIDNRVLIRKGKPLRRQNNVTSFHLIMGFYIFSQKIDYKNLDSMQSQLFIRRGIDEYHSFQCLNIQVMHWMRLMRVKRKSYDLINEILDQVRLNLPQYFSARYLLIAFICYKFAIVDPLLIQDCLTALVLAKKLEMYSSDELHNAFFGEALLFAFNTIDEIMDYVTGHFNISDQQRLKAQKDADLTFMCLNLPLLQEDHSLDLSQASNPYIRY